MKLKLTSKLNSTPGKIFEKIKNPSLLKKIAFPILRFDLIDPNQELKEWEVGKDYTFKLYFLNFLYLGIHKIKINRIDSDKKQIVSNESGSLVKIWNHTIFLEKLSNNQTQYTDELEIQAGLWTLFVWVFAVLFYSHRQNRLRKIFR